LQTALGTLIPIGLERKPFSDLYHYLIAGSWLRLFSLIIGGYLGSNLLFAFGYWLDPGGVENARPDSFADVFFFSVQTMATIGYGKMAPRTPLANILVLIESFVGLLGVAMVTG